MMKPNDIRIEVFERNGSAVYTGTYWLRSQEEVLLFDLNACKFNLDSYTRFKVRDRIWNEVYGELQPLIRELITIAHTAPETGTRVGELADQIAQIIVAR